VEDIYRLAGIMEPRKGYSIKKVIEMLHSQHVRGLSKEMKRAALLMALDAAGISLTQVEHDAKARQDALDAHEAEQRKQVEGEWARKTEEISQIQNEMERAKTHFMARISRNLDAVAREKATFNSWLSIKQQEAQSIAEALELCLKPPIPEGTASSKEVGSATDDSGESASNLAEVSATDLRLAKAASAKTM
jgi:predicted transcriptional regulator